MQGRVQSLMLDGCELQEKGKDKESHRIMEPVSERVSLRRSVSTKGRGEAEAPFSLSSNNSQAATMCQALHEALGMPTKTQTPALIDPTLLEATSTPYARNITDCTPIKTIPPPLSKGSERLSNMFKVSPKQRFKGGSDS